MNSLLSFRYYSMLRDKVRMEGYNKAIHKAIKKGHTVCDIGAGTGILSFMCARAGAKKIFAVEQGIRILEEAKKIAKLNNLDSKVKFLHGHSNDLKLPQKVDVIVSETIGRFGIEEGALESLLDARDRFLKPKGIMIPSTLKMFLVPVSAKKFYEAQVTFWKNIYGNSYEIKNDTKTSKVTEICIKGGGGFLTSPNLISEIDFNTLKKAPYDFKTSFKIEKQSVFHGLLGFFEADLYKGITISNSPKLPPTHWNQVIFPCRDEIKVKKNDTIDVHIKGFRALNHFYWKWSCEVKRCNKTVEKFTLDNFSLKKDELLFGRTDFKPRLTDEGNIENTIFSLCNGERTFHDIAMILHDKMPKRFSNLKSALKKVQETLLNKIKA